MLKQMIAIAVTAGLASGCTSTQAPPQAPIPIDAAALETALTKQQNDIIEEVQQHCQSDLGPLSTLTQDVQQQLKKLQRQVTQLQNTPKPPELAVPDQCETSPIGEKFLLGEVESVMVDELDAYFATRIDTGAESSSIDARNIVVFERDGHKWVRFDVLTQGNDAPPQTFESRVVRFVRIKQDADTDDDRRPVIHAHLKIGKYAAETDLNLTDRSHLDYPLLLGRKFMKDIAVVDVGQNYVHGKAKNQVTSASQ
ncbi:ATP-dependent zinc protease family protein [Shewanella salipaludis]|uniref:ATP-dependent zinc protease n=1 Tax=Shewanella salipaludis TaxID=2723052 RepID=A0A972FPR4_9GAMM|nr:ATP-dependent zinc protease [Shewanella salipaludis]NMH63865.1 ATP-dependent zinc protease [Shewanella salipaludis]